MTTILESLSRVTEAILCPPFKWCHVQGGLVTIENALHYGGTMGGKYQTTSFAIAKYPITNAQYQKFLDDPRGYTNLVWWEYSPQAIQWHKDHRRSKPTAFDGPDFPRTRISWFDSMAFCSWLSANLQCHTRKGERRSFEPSNLDTWSIRLPTEQEWQRAAFDDRDWLYPWGNRLESNCGNYGNAVGHPTNVGSYPDGQSPCGALDLLGNVWEWCLTPWGMDGMDVSGYTYRVLKGGAWNVSNPEYLRATDRYGHPPRGQLNDAGFRCIYSY
jgi:formylglycine-generating enzyme required for sulfatase activity